MNKQTIAVDVDDVLADENEAVRWFFNEHYGYGHSDEDYLVPGEYDHYWERVWGVDFDTGDTMVKKFNKSPDKANLKTIPGAIRAIRILEKNYHLVIITNRDDKVLFDITHVWLERHFPKTFKSVEFLRIWSKDKATSKAAIAKELGASYLIDDNFDHCKLAAEAGLEALLFGDYGWSRGKKLLPNMTKAKDWQAVLDYFDAKR